MINQFTNIWIDYKKVFDSSLQSCIIKCLETTVSKNTRLYRKNEAVEDRIGGWEQKKYGFVNIMIGIFQGDSFSPLLFVIAIIPLSIMLEKINLG